MRVNRIVCPQCAAALTSKAGVETGTSIACPKCKHKFSVAAPRKDEVEVDFEVIDEEEREQRPQSKSRRMVDDDEDDKPRTRSRSRSDDENPDDDRPKAKKRGRDVDFARLSRRTKRKRREEDEDEGLKGNIWVRVGTLGGLLLILAVLSYFLYQKYNKKDDPVTVRSDEDDASKAIKPDTGPKNIKTPGRTANAADRQLASNNLKQIGLALQNYHDAYGAAPLKSAPTLSWRVAILPYIEQNALYQRFKQDEPWDSEHNKKLIEHMPKIFAPPKGVSAPVGQTFLQMAVGPKAMRPGLSLSKMTDGTSNTIAVAEAAQPVIWTKPDDISVPGDDMPADLKKLFGGCFSNGFNAVMWDGSPIWVNLGTVSEKNLWAAITPTGGELLPPNWNR